LRSPGRKRSLLDQLPGRAEPGLWKLAAVDADTVLGGEAPGEGIASGRAGLLSGRRLAGVGRPAADQSLRPGSTIPGRTRGTCCTEYSAPPAAASALSTSTHARPRRSPRASRDTGETLRGKIRSGLRGRPSRESVAVRYGLCSGRPAPASSRSFARRGLELFRHVAPRRWRIEGLMRQETAVDCHSAHWAKRHGGARGRVPAVIRE